MTIVHNCYCVKEYRYLSIFYKLVQPIHENCLNAYQRMYFKNHCNCKQKYIIKLTSKIENPEYLPQICDGEEIPIAHCGGSDDQEPEVISKPEGSFFASIFIVVEWVALVLKKEKKPSRPTYKAKNVGKKLKQKYFAVTGM